MNPSDTDLPDDAAAAADGGSVAPADKPKRRRAPRKTAAAAASDNEAPAGEASVPSLEPANATETPPAPGARPAAAVDASPEAPADLQDAHGAAAGPEGEGASAGEAGVDGERQCSGFVGRLLGACGKRGVGDGFGFGVGRGHPLGGRCFGNW